ncbi:MAG TPA: sigma-70 family RNA polymerase sigma factor [Acidimicrobiales bacterium]|jgi:RNA polymerase sigma factor (sigma-70 family)
MVVIEKSPSTTLTAPPRAPRTRIRQDTELSEVVAAAAAGDSQAWNVLTNRFGGMIMAVARSCRLNDADVGEVHQMTWLRLVENIGRIEQPERIGAWLATTAKRESLRIVRSKARVTFDHEGLLQRPDVDAKPLDAGPIAEESSDAVRRAFALLPAHCQRLLGLLAGDNPPSYKEISKTLSMPIGSIGPTRGRCLEHLRRIMEELGAEV